MVVLAQAILFLVCLLVFLFCWGWRWVTYAPRIMEMVVHCLWFVNFICFYLVLGVVPERERVGGAALLLVTRLETKFFDEIQSWS